MSKIDRVLNSGLTVGQLIEALSDMSPDAVVLVTSDYGDHCHTQQALPVTEVRELEESEVVVESAYSHSGIALETIDEDENDMSAGIMAATEDGGRPNVVILR